MHSIFSLPVMGRHSNIDLIWLCSLLLCQPPVQPPSPDKEKGLTASMVNNHVKHGYHKSQTRKYQRKTDVWVWLPSPLKVCLANPRNRPDLNTLQTKRVQTTLRCFVDYMNHGSWSRKFYPRSCQTKTNPLDLILIKEEEILNEYQPKTQ